MQCYYSVTSTVVPLETSVEGNESLSLILFRNKMEFVNVMHICHLVFCGFESNW